MIETNHTQGLHAPGDSDTVAVPRAVLETLVLNAECMIEPYDHVVPHDVEVRAGVMLLRRAVATANAALA